MDPDRHQRQIVHMTGITIGIVSLLKNLTVF